MKPSESSTPLQSAIEARPVPGAELCKTTEGYAEYWKRGARNEPDRSSALICMEQAVNGWKNLAYDLARQVHYAMRAGYIDDPRATVSEIATRFVQCQYAKDVGMPEHSCSKECVYAKREEPK